MRKGEEPRIEIAWQGIWRDVRVLFDGREIGAVAEASALEQGLDFTLPGELGALRVQLVRDLGGKDIQVRHNGQPLPGTGPDPEMRFKATCGVIFVLAGLNLLSGIAAVALDEPRLRARGYGVGSIVIGAIFLALGYVTMRHRSVHALGAVVGLVALDAALTFASSSAAALSGGAPPVLAALFRLVFLIPLVKGFSAIRDLNEGERGAPAGPP